MIYGLPTLKKPIPLPPRMREGYNINDSAFRIEFMDEEKKPNYFQRLLTITKYFLLGMSAVAALVLYVVGWQYCANNHGMIGVIAMTVVTLLLLAIPKWSKEKEYEPD